MPQTDHLRNNALRALRLLMTPLTRFCLRRSLSIWDFIEVAKAAMVEATVAELNKSTQKVNVSRISAASGLYRRDVTRLLSKKEEVVEEPSDLVGRVLWRWASDKKFLTRDKKPRELQYRGAGNDFFKLVESVSKTINPATILFELERNGRVQRGENTLKLIRAVHQVGDDQDTGYGHLAKDVDTLIEAVSENLSRTTAPNNMHFKTEYDNVYISELPAIREWMIAEGRKLHRNARAFLSTRDKDINADLDDGSAGGGKVTLISVSYTSPCEQTSQARTSDRANSKTKAPR